MNAWDPKDIEVWGNLQQKSVLKKKKSCVSASAADIGTCLENEMKEETVSFLQFEVNSVVK